MLFRSYQLRALLLGKPTNDAQEAERTALQASSMLMLGSHGAKATALVPGSSFNWPRCFALSVTVLKWEQSRGLQLCTKRRAALVTYLFLNSPDSTPPGMQTRPPRTPPTNPSGQAVCKAKPWKVHFKGAHPMAEARGLRAAFGQAVR